MSPLSQSLEISNDGVTLHAMTADDLVAAHALSVEVHWPHRLVDWEFLFSLGEGLVARHEGDIVGTAMYWAWGEAAATLGLVIVAPSCQGRRIGQRLMQGLLKQLEARTVVLHATAEGRGLYERLGFTATGEVRQHQGKAKQAPLIALAPDMRLRPLGRNDADRLIALDAAACGMQRDALVRHLLDTADTVVLDRDGQAQGFAVLRRFGRGLTIGPVVAPDADGAKAMIAHWANLCVGKFVRIDLDFATGMAPWLESLGLRRAGNPIAMVRGPVLQRDADVRVFALAGQALG